MLEDSGRGREYSGRGKEKSAFNKLIIARLRWTYVYWNIDLTFRWAHFITLLHLVLEKATSGGAL